MFKGFNLKYPEYEVITPQTKLSFTLRSLNVSEEENMKGSMMTPLKITEHLDTCLYEVLIKKPEGIVDFKSFLNILTIKDRDALLYGLYHITYEEIRNYEIKCSSCKKEYPITVNASDMFSYNVYPFDDDIKAKRIKVDLPASEGISAFIKQPTLADELDSLKSYAAVASKNMDLITQTLIIDRFEQSFADRAEPVTYTDRGDIIDAYRTLPAKDRRAINTQYTENFGKYGIDLKMRTYCAACGHDEIISVDLVENFFRMVYSV
jgi:hypothetical protein